MDPLTRANILATEQTFLPVVEKMIKFASPDKRDNAVRLLAKLDQSIAENRGILGCRI